MPDNSASPTITPQHGKGGHGSGGMMPGSAVVTNLMRAVVLKGKTLSNSKDRPGTAAKADDINSKYTRLVRIAQLTLGLRSKHDYLDKYRF